MGDFGRLVSVPFLFWEVEDGRARVGLGGWLESGRRRRRGRGGRAPAYSTAGNPGRGKVSGRENGGGKSVGGRSVAGAGWVVVGIGWGRK